MKNSINKEWKNWVYRQIEKGVPSTKIQEVLQRENYSPEIINQLLGEGTVATTASPAPAVPYHEYFNRRIMEMNLTGFEEKLLNNLTEKRNSDLMSQILEKKIIIIDDWLDSDIANELHNIAIQADYKPSGGYEGAILDFQFMNIVMDEKIKRILFLFNELFPGNYLFHGGIGMAKYSRGSYIEEHTDHGGYLLDSVKYQRNITGVLYLNKQWDEKDGGYFHDLENDKKIYPKFNRAVFFEVPHRHLVSAVLNDVDRYSIFMFYSSSKEKYDLSSSRYKKTSSIM